MIFNTSFSNITVMKIAVPIPVLTSGTLTYNGNVQTPTWNYNSSLVQLVSGGSETNAGTYNAVFSLVDPQNYMWEDKTQSNKSIGWTIERAVIDVPFQDDTLVYNGNVQSPEWVNYDSNKMAISSGTTSAIDAGNYYVGFTPTENYKWHNGSTYERSIPWHIERKVLNKLPSQSGVLFYTGEVLEPTWDNYNPLEITMSGETYGKHADNYTATFKPTKNCIWSDGTSNSANVVWVIERASISVLPSQSNTLVYNGNNLHPEWDNYNSHMLDMSGQEDGVNAGNYTTIFTPTSDYKWWDNTTTEKSATWVISKADVTITFTPGGLTLNNSTTNGEFTVTRNSTGEITATTADSSIATVEVNGNVLTVTATGLKNGRADITILVSGDNNYNSGSKIAIVFCNFRYQITTSVNPANSGILKGGGSYSAGYEVEMEAKPRSDYEFVDWTESETGTQLSTENPYIFLAERDIDIVANFEEIVSIPSTLNECTWQQISQLSESGEFANYFSVGDTKTIILNGNIGNGFTANNLAIDLVVAGIDHNAELESPGEHRVHFLLGISGDNVIALTDSKYNSTGYSNYFAMSSSNNTNGWLGSQMRSNIMGGNGTPLNPTANSLMAALPADLRAVMKSVQKYTDNVGGGTDTASNVTSTTEYLCLLAEFEVMNSRKYANSSEKTKQKSYNELFINSTKRHVYTYNDTSIESNSWIRSPVYSSKYNFCSLRSGSSASSSATYSSGIVSLLFV